MANQIFIMLSQNVYRTLKYAIVLPLFCVTHVFVHLGVFVYPLAEKEVVVGFEATIAGRLVGVQIQSRGKLKDCCLDCCPGSGLEEHCGNGREWGCCGSSSLDMHCTNGEEGGWKNAAMEKNLHYVVVSQATHFPSSH